MSADIKKSYGSSTVLVILGLLALYGGAGWLTLLIPAALLVWYISAQAVFGRTKEDNGIDHRIGSSSMITGRKRATHTMFS